MSRPSLAVLYGAGAECLPPRATAPPTVLLVGGDLETALAFPVLPPCPSVVPPSQFVGADVNCVTLNKQKTALYS